VFMGAGDTVSTRLEHERPAAVRIDQMPPVAGRGLCNHAEDAGHRGDHSMRTLTRSAPGLRCAATADPRSARPHAAAPRK
jgi:hypothetical protein